MTMNTREWEALQAIQKTMENLSLRFVVIEEQVSRWRSRDKWLGRLAVASLIGLAVTLFSKHLHL